MRTFVIVVSAVFAMVLLGGSYAFADDAHFAVRAREGMAFVFVAWGGASKNAKVSMYVTPGEGINSQSNGLYLQKAPSSIDMTKVRMVCAVVVQPAELRRQNKQVCTKWGKTTIPADGVISLEFKQ